MDKNREEILKVEGLKQYFRLGSGRKKMVNKAVDDISFTIYKGEVFSLVGESGCGKTTTGRSIIKLYQSSGGEVYFHGTRIVSDIKAAKKEKDERKAELDLEKKEAVAKLESELKEGKISKESYDEQLKEVQTEYKEELNKVKDVYKKIKKDRKFEHIKDENAKKAKKELHTFPEYKEIKERYLTSNQEINSEIKDLQAQLQKAKEKVSIASQSKNSDEVKLAKEKYQKVTTDLKNAQKELKLNKVREKQDIHKLKYSLVNRNRLLMRKMQMIFQDPIASLNPRMTVKEIIAEGLRINGVKNEKEIDDRVKEALKTVGLVPEHASRYPHEFSGGQRQRIGIARALVVEPSFIIADEPISALDVSIRAQVINLLNDLRETQGITIMFIAHDLSVVKYFSDRLAVMYYGHIVEIGDKEKIFTHPLHPYTLSLMDSIPLPDPEYEKRRGRTVRYNPAQQHDYSQELPTLREVEPDHFVLCNTEEFKRYQEKIKD